MLLPDLPIIVRTLALDGFHLDSATHSAGHVILRVHRYDRFGITISYSFAFFDRLVDPAAVEGHRRAAIYEHRHPLVVASESLLDVSYLKTEQFFSALGGVVDDPFVQLADVAGQLDALAHGSLSPGMSGDPELLLEKYVAVSLQFLTGQRARHWGADRRFEKLPDGIVLGAFVLLFDGKAYEQAFTVSADDNRRFADYVSDFNQRYSSHLGPVFAFVVVAGEFAETTERRQRRSADLYAACKTPLCYLTARDLGLMLEAVRATPQLRQAVNWTRVFAGPTASPDLVTEQLHRVQKDNLLRKD